MSNAKELVKIQKAIDNDKSLSEAAASVGWSRQRAHRYFAEGTLAPSWAIKEVHRGTSTDAKSVKVMFGVFIYDVLRENGQTMKEAARCMPDIVLAVGHAYNLPITRLAAFFIRECTIRKIDKKFINMCSDGTVGVRDKIAVAKYISYKDYD